MIVAQMSYRPTQSPWIHRKVK